nr:uncharacterized protein LOC124498030 [Dermatophagoides farinae]XP_046917688.1 uncharacterized protein LOC124498030 [Dermatophagoides farinae]
MNFSTYNKSRPSSLAIIIIIVIFVACCKLSLQIGIQDDENTTNITTILPTSINNHPLAESLNDDDDDDDDNRANSSANDNDDNNNNNDDDDDGDENSQADDEISAELTSESDLQRSTISTTVATTMLMKRETATTTTTTTTTTTPDPFEDFESGELISDGDLKKLSKIIKINDENLPKLKKISTKLNKLVEKVDENHGHIRPELLIDEFLPDPVSVRDIPVSKEDGWLSSYTGQFSNVMMYGIRNVEIKSIRINVGKLYANIVLTISHVFLTGNYTLDGSVSFVSINGDGTFRFNITDMEIEAYGNLERTPDGLLRIDTIDLNMKADEVNLDLENFEVLGSEVIAQTIINALSDIIFDQVKYTVTDKISTKIQLLINKRLEKIEIGKLIKYESEILFDDILAMVAKLIGNFFEPIPLPSFQRQIQTKILQLIPMNISIQIEHGKLYGLTTFRRMGDIYVIYEDESAIIEAEVGFLNLTGKYDWIIDVLGHNGPSGSSSLAINNVTAFLRMRQQLKRGSVPRLEEFMVKNISYVWIEMTGLGIWNNLLELIINSISNIFRLQIANLITSTVSKVLQQALDRSQFSFIP